LSQPIGFAVKELFDERLSCIQTVFSFYAAAVHSLLRIAAARVEIGVKILYIARAFNVSRTGAMPRIKLLVEYDGTNYAGWQFQKGQLSVQEAIENALRIFFKTAVRITGSGRTDAGVHARNQVAHCDIPESDLIRLQRSLNGLLNRDIVVKDVRRCSDSFHARYDAVLRRYCYYLAPNATALNRMNAWQIHFPLNLSLMQAGAEIIRQVENFQSFCKKESSEKRFICRIDSSRWFVEKEMLVYEISANRFIHGMVRALVGCLVELGRGKLTLAGLHRIIQARDRNTVPYAAPARGLALEDVWYE
jgi:tRNA pseudouridine38-40 synthase